VSISALVLAQKVWDDTPLINADFSILYPALNVKEINFLERKFLDLLEFKVGLCRSGAAVCAHSCRSHRSLWQLTVSPSLYAQYYFELRSICEENNANFRPLTKAQVRAGCPLSALRGCMPSPHFLYSACPFVVVHVREFS
jgi:hypothetical protein